MLFNLSLITSLLAFASATPLRSSSSAAAVEKRENWSNSSEITYLGSQGKTLSGGTKFGNLVWVSGQVPIFNGTVVPGGVANETAFVIEAIGAILEEAGTDWSRVLETTVLLQDINDLAKMNEVYSAMIPNPKPARAAFEVGNLPVAGISVEIRAIAALP